MMKHKEGIKLFLSAIFVAFLFILASYLFGNYEPNINQAISAGNVLGMFFFVLVFILSIVFAPLTAMPLIPIGTRLWGIPLAATLSVIGWTIGAMIAFKLARKLGRPLVKKVVPLGRIDKIEKMIPETNVFWTIFFLRAVTPFDGFSYVLGLLTRVKQKTFFLGTFFGLIPFCLVVSFYRVLLSSNEK